MHSYSKNHNRQQSPLTAVGIGRHVLCLCLGALLGCSQYAENPEVNPRAWAPTAVEREWSPPPAAQKLVGSAAEVAALSDLPAADRNRVLGLNDLLAFALKNN